MDEEYTVIRQYSKEELRKLQQIEKEILDDFREICDAAGLTWFAIGGTLLGAVRHQDMIPWDDDIDIGILREDYQRLKEIVSKKHSDKYMILDAEENEHFPLMTGHFIRKGTVFIPEYFKGIPCSFGIFLDLFPFDTLHPRLSLRKTHMRKAWMIGKLRILRELGNPYVAGDGIKRSLILLACQGMHFLLRILKIDRKKLYRDCLRWCRIDETESSPWYGFSCDTKPFDNMIVKEDLYPVSEVPFGETTIHIPANYDKLLRDQYGDYMKLPPEDKRKNHYPYKLDFGEYANMEIRQSTPLRKEDEHA